MRNLLWICWYLWEGLPTLLAFPINLSKPSDIGDSWSSHWEDHWPGYAIGTLGFVVVAFTLAGCLCCRRQRHPKGFQDDAGNCKEFKDGSTAGTETTIERHPSASLELEVPRIASPSALTASSKVQFEALPVDNLPLAEKNCRPPGKPKPLFADEDEIEKNLSRDQPCREWFEAGNCHVPRERLKYLREIGRGWFGKVVEGTTESPDNATTKNRGVVVRILTEEATSREKAWFLGEATPYLKLRHPNIVTLLGACLETDPYLLLFESCPAGDLKGFLRSNRDAGTCEALRKENVPTRMALDIANALEHMHENDFAHTDLSARNCLVAPDLSAKLGDYGTGVDKYPGDYYVVGDRALPIRWSAPESLECTATTIETRAITPRANLWSYGILLWEIATWAERPYDDYGDEQVIEMIFSLKSGQLDLAKKIRDEQRDIPQNFRKAIEALLKFLPDGRASLEESREIICGKTSPVEDFEKRWENLRPNGVTRAESLQDLRNGSDSGGLFREEKDSSTPQARFRLGPDEPVKYAPSSRHSNGGSGSETEEESWRGRVERGAYTEKVKQKSKSVADLMVLVHIDSDSDAEISLGAQSTEKPVKKRVPASGSDGDLRCAVLADEFDEAIRKLREPSVCDRFSGAKTSTKNHPSPEILESAENHEKPKLLTLTQQGQMPILRLSFAAPTENLPFSSNVSEKVADNLVDNNKDNVAEASSSAKSSERTRVDELVDKKLLSQSADLKNEENQDKAVSTNSSSKTEKTESPRIEGHVLRLVAKGDPNFPLLRYVPEAPSNLGAPSVVDESSRSDVVAPCFSNDFEASQTKANESLVDVELWNNALAFELEKKNPGYDIDTSIFEHFDNLAGGDKKIGADYEKEEITMRSASVPNTPAKLIARRDFTTQSVSAPDTPRKYNYCSEIDNVGSSTAATPRSVENVDEDSSSTGEDLEASERMMKGSASAPDTPQSRGNYSVGNGDEDSSTAEELEAGMIKRSAHDGADDEEDRKHLSTPDDERSSDSGFRDKESCEEEESPVPCPATSSIILSNTISSSGIVTNSSPLSASAEEEQMRILFELDTILDAEYYDSFQNGEKFDDDDEEEEILSPSDVQVRFVANEFIDGKNRSFSESLESTESTDIMETVRANSCEPDFSNSRFSRDFQHDELNKEDAKNLLEICDTTEADPMSEYSVKTEKNQSVETSNVRQNLSADSEKNDSADSSSVQFCRIDADSSDSQGKCDESTNLSLELRSSEQSTSPGDDRDKPSKSSSLLCESADLADSSSAESPLKSDKNPSTDFSLDIRLNNSSDVCKASEIDLSDSTSQSPLKTDQKSEDFDKPSEMENSTSQSPLKTDQKSEDFDKPSELDNSTSDSPLKTDRCHTSDFSMETRAAESGNLDATDQWSSRENVNENENDDEDSSTMSLRSDNSYVSFGLDEEFVAAIRNELREKLPRAQMPVVEALDPRDEKEPSINEDVENKRWEDEETDENLERGSGGVDISIRYNIYGTPLSPILEERESAGTSESLVSKEDSRDASIASRVSALSEDVLVVDTRTNRAMMLEVAASGNGDSANLQQEDDRDTSHGDFSDEENLDYPQNHLNRGMESRKIQMGSGGAPLPSPEEESKWQQQFPLPMQLEDDLMSTSFGTDRDWDSQDDDEGEDDAEDGDEDEEENSSSSGEFVWKRYDESHGDLENVATRSPPNKPKSQEPEAELDEDEEDGDEDGDEEEEEFTPSAWDATLAPHRSALKSPEKTLKSGDQKKSVWFKKQRYHCVYEYPKETPVPDGPGQAATTWEPTSYADWEEMMEEPRLDAYPMEYDETNRPGDEEFYVSSSNRPFQFQSGEGKYVSQFFPGASSTLLQQQQSLPPPFRDDEDCQESQDEVDRGDVPVAQLAPTNGNPRGVEFAESQQQTQQTQLGELRHTRDRLKLNLLSTSGAAKTEEDVGIENRTTGSSSENIENTDKETSGATSGADEALKTVENLSIVVQDKEESNEESRSAELGSVENSPEKTVTFLSHKCEDNQSPDRRTNDKSSVIAKVLPEDNEKLVQSPKNAEEKPENPLKLENKVADSNKIEPPGTSRIEGSNEEAARKEVEPRSTFPSDDLAVIPSEGEANDVVTTSSSKEGSRLIGNEEDSSNTKTVVEATSDSVAGQIVDKTKLGTEECSSLARKNSAFTNKSENTEGADVQDANAVPSTIHSPDEKTDEDLARSLQS